MSNQQLYPSNTYPISGDVQSTPGSPTVTVVGIQTVPFSATPPLPGQIPVAIGGQWVPSNPSVTDANQSIQVNGVVMSDDYQVSVNAVLGISNSPLYVNGT